MAARAAVPGGDRSELHDALERWVARGLISPEQAERILADEQGSIERRARRGPLVAEALGYVGGVLILVGAVAVAERYWSDIGLGGRLGVTFGAAGLLLVTGLCVPARRVDVARRLRSVCWLLSAVLLAAGLGRLGTEVLELDGDTVALLTSGVTAAYTAVLWWRHRTVLQQAALLVALTATAAAAAAHLPHGADHVTGLAVWGVGAGWLLLGWGGVITARTGAYVLGGSATVLGGLPTVEAGWGAALAIGSALVLVAAGAWLRDLLLLAVGSIATLLTVPSVLGQYFPDTLTVPLALVGCGVLLVAGAVHTSYRRRLGPPSTRPGVGNRAAAIGAAATVAVAVTVAVLALAW
ncbi:DUF2157 domain-containing protein [Pseudonocardia cypriaca]|uniref:DUF2157 domain-containing protein n=1 Tax=Pseudonocardia cypriaca TaxID=882449 RepID=UPI001476F6E2|nr:DUF2157 domain-containing protein [Pseudonocardia cypriaca]